MLLAQLSKTQSCSTKYKEKPQIFRKDEAMQQMFGKWLKLFPNHSCRSTICMHIYLLNVHKWTDIIPVSLHSHTISNLEKRSHMTYILTLNAVFYMLQLYCPSFSFMSLSVHLIAIYFIFIFYYFEDANEANVAKKERSCGSEAAVPGCSRTRLETAVVIKLIKWSRA